MKRLLIILVLVLLSCEKDYQFTDSEGTDFVLIQGETNAIFQYEGDSKSYRFSSLLAWKASASSDWIEVSPSEGSAGINSMKITIGKNNGMSQRSGEVNITLSNGTNYFIKLRQLAENEDIDDIITSIVPNNEIWYTTTDGQALDMKHIVEFGATIISCTYEDGKGIIRFDADISKICAEAFYDQTTLSTIYIPESITTVEQYAFQNCTSLTGVYISNLAAWCDIDFEIATTPNSINATSNPLLYAHNLYINGKLATDIVIPEGVTKINDIAFAYCTSIENITIPNSVTTIGDYAFYGCSNIRCATIGTGVKAIGGYAFWGCESLTKVNIFDIAAWCDIDFIDGDPTDYDNSSANPLTYACNLYLNNKAITDLVIPDGVTKIKHVAFFNCINIKNVTIPDSVTAIENSAFCYCRNMTSINIGERVATIGKWAFCECSSLTSINIPDNVTTIESCAFIDCSSLKSITIPDSVITIDNGAFSGCTNLQSAIIGDGVKTIGYSAFNSCSNLETISIGRRVKTIGGYAFSGCEKITKVNISDIAAWCNIDFIDGDTSNSFNIAANPLCYSGELYLNNRLITDLNIPNGVTEIKQIAFIRCPSIKNVTIPNSIIKIGYSAFYMCDGLTNITLGNRVTTIDDNAFWRCSNLTSITIPDSVTVIGRSAFYECSKLNNVTIGNSVTTIEDYAFCKCSGLTSVTIPNNTASIGYATFADCSSLTSVYCKATTPPSVGKYDGYWHAFANNASSRKIYVPTDSASAYKSAEGWSEYSSYINGYNY